MHNFARKWTVLLWVSETSDVRRWMPGSEWLCAAPLGTRDPWGGKHRLLVWVPPPCQPCDPGPVYLVFCFLSWKSLTDEMKCCVRLNFPSRTVIVWWHVVSVHCHHLFEIMKFIVIKKEWVCGLSAPGILAGKISASSPCHLLHTCGFHPPPWKQTYLGDFSFFWLPGVACRISEFPGQGLNTQSLGNETCQGQTTGWPGASQVTVYSKNQI